MRSKNIIVVDKLNLSSKWMESSSLAPCSPFRHFSSVRSLVKGVNDGVDVIYIVKDAPPKPDVAVLCKKFPDAQIIAVSAINDTKTVVAAPDHAARFIFESDNFMFINPTKIS